MTDEQTLLAAIIARPLDDQMRLGYADWLEETATREICPRCHGQRVLDFGPKRQPGPRIEPLHIIEKTVAICPQCDRTGEVSNGHAERAEFIRVQCTIARFPPTYCSSHDRRNGIMIDLRTPCTCKLCALRRRERELLDLHRLKWLPTVIMDIEAQTFGPSHAYHRGFVESLTCSWSVWRTHADAIRKATPLRKVRTDMPDDERRKCWTFNPPHAETFLRHPDYKGIEFELPQQEGDTLVTFNIPVRNPRHSFVMRAE